MGGGESYRGRRSHDDYAREALSPIRRSILTLYRAIETHSGRDRLTFFVREYGGAFGLTPEHVYRGRVTRVDQASLLELITIARENGFIPDPFAEVVGEME